MPDRSASRAAVTCRDVPGPVQPVQSLADQLASERRLPRPAETARSCRTRVDAGPHLLSPAMESLAPGFTFGFVHFWFNLVVHCYIDHASIKGHDTGLGIDGRT